jgi:hypothetical protein
VPRIGTTRTYRCPPDHRHETATTCYSLHKCGCGPCVAANTRRQEARRKRIAYGRHLSYRVEKTEPLNHVRLLRGLGWSNRRIADAAGIPLSVVDALVSNRFKRTTRTTAEAILKVKPVRVELWGRVSSLGAGRRLQALAYQGWPMAELERRYRFGNGFLSTVYGRPLIDRSSDVRVRAVFEELWDQPPPETNPVERAAANRARNLARRKGWVGPLHWDDIDDPNERPAVKAEGPRVSVLDELDHLRAQGESPAQAVRAVGRNPGALEQMARRKNRPDLAAWVAAA